MDQAKIGSFLKDLRKEKNLTQEQLAERFGVAARTVSRWENGNNMPDLALLVELADFYEVDIRELIDGERKSETVNEGVKETLERVSEYSHEIHKKKTAKVVWLMSIPIVVLAILLIIVFSSRSRQVVPDTYPSYPQVYLDETVTDPLIKEYVIAQMPAYTDDSHNFCNVQVYSAEEKQDGDYYVYAWVMESAYSYHAGVLSEEAGSSYPCRFELIRENDSLKVVRADVPRDGDYNAADRQKLFPGYVLEMLGKVQEDGTVSRLSDEALTDAKAFFKVS